MNKTAWYNKGKIHVDIAIPFLDELASFTTKAQGISSQEEIQDSFLQMFVDKINIPERIYRTKEFKTWVLDQIAELVNRELIQLGLINTLH